MSDVQTEPPFAKQKDQTGSSFKARRIPRFYRAPEDYRPEVS